MHFGASGIIWSEAAQELRITYVNGADKVLKPSDIPQSIWNQGPQAVQDWINANAEKFLWGPTAPPPFFRCTISQLVPILKGQFVMGDEPIPSTVFERLATGLPRVAVK
jgi:hypothetical protein